MTEEITITMSIAEIVVKHPETRKIFEKMGIDYCCGGRNSLKDACEKAGLSPQKGVQKLRKVIEASGRERSDDKDLDRVSLEELIDHIVSEHHAFLKKELPRLKNLREKVYQAHQQKHGRMLENLGRISEKLRIDIEMHLAKEEQILFPAIEQIENHVRQGGPEPEIHCGRITNPINQMEYEHEVAGSLLAEIQKTTSDYNPPADACESFKALYDGLRELEDNLHEHIHLENNILFPKAVQLEEEMGI
jgi:regulator of cell morphogenesis and NO signaling